MQTENMLKGEMSKAAQRVLVVIVAMFLSAGIWFGSVITALNFRVNYTGDGPPPEFFMPMLTNFAVAY